MVTGSWRAARLTHPSNSEVLCMVFSVHFLASGLEAAPLPLPPCVCVCVDRTLHLALVENLCVYSLLPLPPCVSVCVDRTLHLALVENLWVYGILRVLSWPMRVAFMAVNVLIGVGLFFLGKGFDNLIWGEYWPAGRETSDWPTYGHIRARYGHTVVCLSTIGARQGVDKWYNDFLRVMT